MKKVEHVEWVKSALPAVAPKRERTCPQEEYFRDKSVVIVGPSPSLKGSGQGEYIDSFDIVVRVNKGWWPATTLDPEFTEYIAEQLYECYDKDDYQSYEHFKEIEYHILPGCLQNDIGSRTDVLYNNYDTNTSSGGIMHPAIFIEAGIEMIIGSRYPTDELDVKECERFLLDHAMWGGIGTGLVNAHIYQKAMANLRGKTPHAGHSAILDLIYGNGKLAKSVHITGFSYYGEMPAREYYMGSRAWKHVNDDFDESMNSQTNDGHEYGHDNTLEIEDIARLILKEGPDGNGRVTCDQLLKDRIRDVIGVPDPAGISDKS